MIKKNSIQKEYIKKKLEKKLSKKFENIFSQIKINIKNEKKIFNLFNKNYKFNFKIKDLKKFKNYKTIVIIGMGGSVIGANSIYDFFGEKIKKNFYFLDSINPQKVLYLKKSLKFDKTLFVIISKSGNTIETLSNLLFLKIINKKRKNIIFISERKDNILFNLAQKFHIFFIEHKNFIGGRYSVLSEVGMVPAHLMGLNINKIRKKIRLYFKSKEKKFLKDSSIKLANILMQKKINNLIFINYSPQLEKFLSWCQQLIAESLGKNRKGFLPVISNSPKDHHSLLQLYLDGPKDKLFHIFSYDEKTKDKINTKNILGKVNYLNNKSLVDIRNAQKNALIKTFKKKGIPFREFIINDLKEETLGQLFSYFILETITVGQLIGINPFDQPAVEQVKVSTKKILK